MQSIPTATRLFLVFCGGVVGTLLRAGIGQLWVDSFPWATLAVNLLGSLALGVLAGSLSRRSDVLLANLIGAGVLGSLTTFSAFAVEAADLARSAGPSAGVAYAGASMLLGVALAAHGFRWGSA